MSEETYDEMVKEIDALSHEELCRRWRFETGNRRFFDNTEEISKYFQDRLFKHFGGFTPEISKRIGWQ